MTHLISGLNGEETVWTFYENKIQKTNQKEFRVEKIIKKEKMENYMPNKKDMIIH